MNNITSDDLINYGYKKRGNWFVHESEILGINLASNTIRGYKPDFFIERKDNKVSLSDLDAVVACLIKLCDLR